MTAAARVASLLDERDLLELVAAVGRARGVTVQQICGRQRTQAVARARHEVWWQLRHHPERHYSLVEIGRLFGRGHTTVRHGIDLHTRRGGRAGEPLGG